MQMVGVMQEVPPWQRPVHAWKAAKRRNIGTGAQRVERLRSQNDRRGLDYTLLRELNHF